MFAGVGMFGYVARDALGGGPNLVCTCLLLSLFQMCAEGIPLGRRLFLTLDNTTGENKCECAAGI